MQESKKFNQAEQVIVKGETIKGFLLNLKALTTASVVCAIASNGLNKIGLDINVKRKNGRKTTLFAGYLDDYLTALYSQTPRYELATTADDDGYKMLIDWGGILHLGPEDELVIDINAPSAAFTSLSLTTSSIFIETIPAYGVQTGLPKVNAIGIGNGTLSINEQLEQDLVKVVLATDYTADYIASTKAKPVSVQIEANDYNFDATEDLLVALNSYYLDMNPESAVRHLVIYSGDPLNNAKIKSKLTQASDADAKILTVHGVSA